MQRLFTTVLAIAVACGLAESMLAQRGRRGVDQNRVASTNPLGKSREVIDSGRLLYNSSCTMCHGLEGTAGDRGPALAASRRYLRRTDDDLFAAIKKGIPGTLMPATGL